MDEDLETQISDFADTVNKALTHHGDALESIAARLDGIEPDLSQSQGRVTDPDGLPGDGTRRPTGQRATVLGSPGRGTGHGGYQHAGEFFASVRNAGLSGGTLDDRLQAAAATTWGNESSGSDGGFAVPPDFRNEILEKAFGQDSLIGRCMTITTAGNSLTIPSTMTTPWSSSGVQAYWEAEAAAITQSKPSLEQVNLRLSKLACLVPVSDELLEDAPAMGALVSREASEKIDYKLSTAIAYGSGAGQPLGFMNSPCLVTVSGEGGQTADTINATNVAKMVGRLPLRSRTRAAWLIHPDAEHQLPLMPIGDQPVYLPPGGLRGEVFGRLMGLPVIPHQVCQTVGDLGDIMLVDLGEYLIALKQGGMRAATSIHLWFDQSLTAFRFIIRVAGQPWWSEVTTAANGSFEQSPFVTLAART